MEWLLVRLAPPFFLSASFALVWITTSRRMQRTPLRLSVSLTGTLLVLLVGLLFVWASAPTH